MVPGDLERHEPEARDPPKLELERGVFRECRPVGDLPPIPPGPRGVAREAVRPRRATLSAISRALPYRFPRSAHRAVIQAELPNRLHRRQLFQPSPLPAEKKCLENPTIWVMIGMGRPQDDAAGTERRPRPRCVALWLFLWKKAERASAIHDRNWRLPWPGQPVSMTSARSDGLRWDFVRKDLCIAGCLRSNHVRGKYIR